MTIYFVFSDEAGDYQQNRGEKFCKTFPFYVRSTIMMDANCWSDLIQDSNSLRQLYGFPEDREIKWSYIWSLKKYRNNDQEIPEDKPYYFLKDISEAILINYVEKMCAFLNKYDIPLILTVTNNKNSPKISDENIYKMHLQDIMQRIEMEIQNDKRNLAIFFFDNINPKVEKNIRQAYFNIYQSGDFIENYSHIKDSMSFEFSHHSIGIQIADYCAGIFNGVLRGFDQSIWLFAHKLFPRIRKSTDGTYLGYGVLEIPTNPENRSLIERKISIALEAHRF